MSGLIGGVSLGASLGPPGWLGSGSSSGRGLSDIAVSFRAYNPGPRRKVARPGVRQVEVARPAILAIGRALEKMRRRAGVAELVDALVLGTSIARCGGSSPFARTNLRYPRLALSVPGDRQRSRELLWDFILS